MQKIKIAGKKNEQADITFVDFFLPVKQSERANAVIKKLFSFLDKFPYDNSIFIGNKEYSINANNSRDIRLKVLELLKEHLRP